VGLEGSDYSLNTARANWPAYHQKVLFTCDLTQPFAVKEDDAPRQFDCITAWEVIEHIAREDLPMFFGNIRRHLKPDGIFCGSISLIPSWVNGVNLHQSVFPRETWEQELLPKDLTQKAYPFQNSINDSYVRDGQSFLICLSPRP
jgi:cyclopropane fatty-acyl-phospholipid synthase-like methyltransferase